MGVNTLSLSSGSWSSQKYLLLLYSCLSNGLQQAGRSSAHSGVAGLHVLPTRSRVASARLLRELLGKQAAILPSSSPSPSLSGSLGSRLSRFNQGLFGISFPFSSAYRLLRPGSAELGCWLEFLCQVQVSGALILFAEGSLMGYA